MSGGYIRRHFDSIRRYANVIETRLDDTDCTADRRIAENGEALRQCRLHHQSYLLIDASYTVNIEL